MVLAFNKAERGQFLVLAQCAPFRRVPRPVHWAVGLPSTCPLLLPPAKRAERSLSLLFSMPGPPPIALAISYGSSSSKPQGPALRGQSGLSGQPPFELRYVRGSFAFARSREILRVLRPRFHRRGHLVHRYYQRVSCLRYYCY